jgi:hypothetical protein
MIQIISRLVYPIAVLIPARLCNRSSHAMFAYCNHMLELFSSIISSVLTGLRIYLAEKHKKQDKEETTSPFGRSGRFHLIYLSHFFRINDLSQIFLVIIL